MGRRRFCLLFAIAASALVGQRRSLSLDMAALAATLYPPLQVRRPARTLCAKPFGSLLIVFNHYSLPDVPVWWTVIALGGALDHIGLTGPEPRWVMTAAWRHWGMFMPISRWMLRCIARVYDAFLMPPMPPAPEDAAVSATAVRAVINLARSCSDARICLAPEGRDSGDGRLIMPPSGVGRFIFHLCRAGMDILPAGIWQDDQAWHVCFGPTFTLDAPNDLGPDARDEWAARRVMAAIAELVPERLRGEFR
jgi:hypothetical protein